VSEPNYDFEIAKKRQDILTAEQNIGRFKLEMMDAEIKLGQKILNIESQEVAIERYRSDIEEFETQAAAVPSDD